MTFNIRYDDPLDGKNSWRFRKEFVTDMVRFYDPDVLGLQEVLQNQLTDIVNALADYSFTGVPRKDGLKTGEYCPVFYKKDKFELREGDTFWLSENPSVAGSKGWDASIERIVTWVKLKEKITEKEFVIFNTHFDHDAQVARMESARLLILKTSEIGKDMPVFISGDFNSTPESEPVRFLTDVNSGIYLTDSRSVAPSITGPAWTSHGFDKIPVEKRPIIDYIFIGNKIKVEQVSVIFERQDDLFLSDHNPVLINAFI